MWVYYSGIVVLFGAELTQAYANRLGKGLGTSRADSQGRAEVAAV